MPPLTEERLRELQDRTNLFWGERLGNIIFRIGPSVEAPCEYGPPGTTITFRRYTPRRTSNDIGD
jgi:hypothetical protein